MTQHIIETDDLVQGLKGRARFCRARGEIKTPELLERAAERIAEHERSFEVLTNKTADLLANSPQADGMVLDDAKIREIFNLWRHLDEIPKGLYVRFKRAEAEMLSAYKPQADKSSTITLDSKLPDDVRKDALEQAAKIAEQMPLNCDEEHHAYRFSDDSKAIAWDIAHAIRQAIDKARE